MKYTKQLICVYFITKIYCIPVYTIYVILQLFESSEITLYCFPLNWHLHEDHLEHVILSINLSYRLYDSISLCAPFFANIDSHYSIYL